MGLLPKVAALAAIMLCSGVARALDPPPQPIEISAADAFTHKHSHVRLPPVLTGLPRTSVMENEPNQLHTSLRYASADRGEAYIVIIYREIGGGLPVWFDRARRRAERGADETGIATPHSAGAFVPPGRANASGLLATYALTGKGFRSTGVAMVPAGEWLVTFWAASATLSPAELGVRIKATLAEIAWPKTGPAPAAVPVAACASALAWSGDAMPVTRAGNRVAESLQAAVTASQQKPQKRAVERWCRDPIELDRAGVYRADEQEDGYLLAINDSGRGVRIARLAHEGADARARPERYQVQVLQMSKIGTSELLDRLPPPAQALSIALDRPLSVSFGTWGEDKGKVFMTDEARKALRAR